jgi:tetratricopeptide (TPR) repeat protein
MNQSIDSGPLIERGKALHRQDRLGEAMSIYRQVLAVDQKNADALHLLGVIANQQGDHARAAQLISQALKYKPAAEHFHCNLGLALMGVGDLDGAHARFLDELANYPHSHASRVNLGVLLQKRGRHEQAVTHYRAALLLLPHDVTVLNNLGFAYMELCKFDAARDIAERSLQIQRDNPDALNLLGLASRHQDRPGKALEYYKQALQFRPSAAEIYQNRGHAHKDLGEYDKALADYGQALRLKPDYPDPHFSRGLLLLQKSEFEEGWREYEYGLLCGERVPSCRMHPRWHGESIENRALLVCAEQGLGDEIMFASILPEIVGQAGHGIVECDARLVPIYERSFPAATVIYRRKPGEDDSAESLPHVDFQTPVGSLPLYRRNRLEDFSQHAGYLKAEPERVAYWKARLDALGPGLKIGISWRGGTPKTGLDRRSIPLADWLPVFKQGGIQFVSLQYTNCDAEIAALEEAEGIKVTHWQDVIDDYDETAALVCALDLVITVQTAIFHLAGALGRPVWGLLPIPAEWRYMQAGGTLPWYPSARLFRQVTFGDWNDVLRAVGVELRCLANRTGESG